MIIDTHTHWIPPTLMDVLQRRAAAPRVATHDGVKVLEFAPGKPYPLADDLWDENAKLVEMDKHEIDFAVVSVVGGMSVIDLVDPRDAPAVSRAANEELADLVRRHPERFAALAALPLQSGQHAVDEFEHAVSIGLRGAMVYSNVAGHLLDSNEFIPVFAAAERLDVPIQIHPTEPLSRPWTDTGILASGIGYLFDTTTAALRLILRGIYEDLPALKIQLVHAGSLLPYIIGRLDNQAADLPAETKGLSEPPSAYIRKLYTDTVCLWPPALRLALEVFGPGHVMFGTDAPYWAIPPAFETLRRVDLSPSDLAQVQSKSAVELFGLQVPTAHQ